MVDFDELLITTGVDALIKLIKEKKEIELIEAAEILKLPVQDVREWAQVLEDEGLISIRYKLAKSYLCWIQPTVEQIEEEKISFSREKKSLSKELTQIKEKFDSEKQTLEQLKLTFKQLYDNLYPKLEELDERTKSLDLSKKEISKKVPTYDSKLTEINSKLDDLDSMLVFTQSQLNKTKKDIVDHTVTIDEISSLKSIKEGVSVMNRHLSDLEKKAYSTIKSLPKDTVKYADFSKELSEIKGEFKSMLSESKKAREFFGKTEENLKTFKNLKKQMGKKGFDVPALQLELSKLSKSLEGLEKNFSSLSKKVSESKKAVDSFGSVEETIKKISQPDELKNRLEQLEQKEKKLGGQIEKLEKSSSDLSGVAELVQDFEKIRKEIDEKRDKLSENAADIFQRLDEEDETYQVFQTIKEKAVSSIEEYSQQLSSIKSELNNISGEIRNIESHLKTGIESASKSTTVPEVSSLLSKLEEVKKKKVLFDDIRGSISGMESSLESLSKRLSLLSKQANLIEIRSGKEGRTPEVKKEEEELENEVELTKTEQVEFQRKRKELMNMIKKLWEES